MRRAVLLAVLVCAMQLPAPAAMACAVCYGAPDDPMTKGVNNGIWVLLGVVGFVQIGFAAMFWSFWKRARAQRRFRDQFRVVHASALGPDHSSNYSSYRGGSQE